ncbi:Uma2 family endonuclease [Dyadobacter sp. CY356]|uniref:Uma2 family endonuclease n=1 Tax=Dyadobacter sp. CY356 TaxID=2906442 RepID=UPI001F38ED6C|nr:Uma2 family endonuclease [Dyadobacter sp. CY356]MCF0056874.1 Uma2 family endonuclease [Dyadobacter sp. CY356]
MSGKNNNLSKLLRFRKINGARCECYNGHLFILPEESGNHNRIIHSIIKSFNVAIPQSQSIFAAENVILETVENYFSSDVMLIQQSEGITTKTIARRPFLLAEVSSEFSSGRDRGYKLREYLKISSLQYYLLVSQYECYVELYTKTDQEGVWTYQSFKKPDAIISFDLLDFTMPVSAVYEGIVFLDEEKPEFEI